MNQLPQELIDEISEFLPRKDLKNVLTLSSKFHYAAERYSGAFTRYDMNECNTKRFSALYSGHRLLYLREVTFKPRFSPIHYQDDPKVPCRETAEELQEKDESFTSQITLLFAILTSTEERAGVQNSPGRYRLSIYSPTRLVEKIFGDSNCLHHYYVSWRIHLLNPSALPEISSVRSLEIHNHGYEYDWNGSHGHDYPIEYRDKYDGVESKLDLRVIVDLATKFPNLEFLGCKVGGYEWCQTYYEEQPAKHY